MTSSSPDETDTNPRHTKRSPASSGNGNATLLGLLMLAIVWAGMVIVVNPVGEFMINDDWSYQRALENWVVHGRIQSTGWGPSSAPGGPSIIFHLAWGRLFQVVFGDSSTVLRFSVLVLGFLGSIALFLFLRAASASGGCALWATLTLVMNPLFLSQCFTFMTDITFTATAIFSLWFLYLGVQRERILLLVVGLGFALCSVLTRQVALVIPLAFVIACFVYRGRLVLGALPALAITAGVVIAPWLCYELLLFSTGGTPLTQHQVFQNLWHHAQDKDLGTYLDFLVRNLRVIITYVSVLILPALALRYRELVESRGYMVFFVTTSALLVVTEVALMMSLADVEVSFAKNVIFDLGLGPVLLKDTYVLEIRRSIALPSPLFCVVIYGAILSAGTLFGLVCKWLSKAFTRTYVSENPCRAFLEMLCFLAGFMYAAGIMLTGFQDRYLIPMCVFGITWVVAGAPAGTSLLRTSYGGMLAGVYLLGMGFFSVAGLHDFMAMKRALKSAQDFVVKDLRVAPGDFDGGFEFNGYHCYQPDFKPGPGLSWWWVHRETYVLTLGPLPGYETVRTFPFRRILGGKAAVEVLKPDKPGVTAQ